MKRFNLSSIKPYVAGIYQNRYGKEGKEFSLTGLVLKLYEYGYVHVMVTYEVCNCDTHIMHGQQRPVCFSRGNMNWRHYLNLWTWSFSKSRHYEFVRTICVAVTWCYEVPKSFVFVWVETLRHSKQL